MHIFLSRNKEIKVLIKMNSIILGQGVLNNRRINCIFKLTFILLFIYNT